jgi:hypothetical protein
MPRTHDGITCPLPLNPISVIVALGALAAGAWLLRGGSIAPGVGLLVVGALVGINQYGGRRVRVLQPKLLVEDERLLVALLIGPRRSRVEWDKVKAVRVDKGALVLDTDGAPFVTAQGASRDDLELLRGMAEEAWKKARTTAAEV